MRWFAVLLLSVALAAPSGPGHAAERRPDLGSAYMVGLDIHTPSGRVVKVPLPRKRATWTQLYGRTEAGWLVGVGCGVYLVADGRATRFSSRNCSDLYTTELLTDDGKAFVEAADAGGAGTEVSSQNLDGSPATGAFVVDGGDVEDASSTKAYVPTYDDGLFEVDLTTGDTTRVMRRRVTSVDISADVVFVESPRNSGFVGPTSLTEPGPVAWRAAFGPTDVSPDGARVLGYVTRPGGSTALEVRLMSDGSVVRRMPAPGDDDYYEDVGWDGNSSVVMVKSFGKRRAIVSCGVPRGRCRRVTAPSRFSVTLPSRVVGPERSPSL